MLLGARSRKMHLSMLKIGRNFSTLLRELLGHVGLRRYAARGDVKHFLVPKSVSFRHQQKIF